MGIFCGTTITGPVTALQAVNNCTIVGGIPLLFTGILFIFWLIIYVRGRQYGIREALATATFSSGLLAVMFRLLHLITDETLGIAVVLFVLATVALWNKPEPY